MKTLLPKPSERVEAYKAFHIDSTPAGAHYAVDGSIVNLEGNPRSFNWVQDFDLECSEYIKENTGLDRLFNFGGRRWFIHST